MFEIPLFKIACPATIRLNKALGRSDFDVRRWTLGVFCPNPVSKTPKPLNISTSLKTHSSAQHFHGVSANPNVRDPLAISCCSHIHFARTMNFDALPNPYLFVTVCDPVLYHPT